MARLVVTSAPDVPVDADAVVRRASLQVGRAPAFAAAVANVPVPDPAAVYRINFLGPAGASSPFRAMPWPRWATAGEDLAEDNPLRGRIVLVGATFADSRDLTGRRTALPGVEVHANIVHMLATGRLLRPAGWLASLGVQLGAVLVAGLLLVAVARFAAPLCWPGAPSLGVPASYLAFNGGGYCLDFVLPVAATGLIGLGAEALARRRFRDSFGRYVGREVEGVVRRTRRCAASGARSRSSCPTCGASPRCRSACRPSTWPRTSTSTSPR